MHIPREYGLGVTLCRERLDGCVLLRLADFVAVLNDTHHDFCPPRVL